MNGVSASVEGEQQKFLSAVAKDLQEHRGSSVVLAGDHQPAVVHALAHAMNGVLGNVGKTVMYTDTVDAHPVDQTTRCAIWSPTCAPARLISY